MYKLYNDLNIELKGRYRDDISYFEKDEKYAIKDGTEERIHNSNYNKKDSDAFKKEIYVSNILNSNDQEAIAEYNANRCNPDHENYDYCYARCNTSDGYGTVEEQLEYIAENGFTDFKNRQMEVKARYPKNEN